MSRWSIPRESVEYIPFGFTVEGSPVTAGVKVAVTAANARPTVWTDAAVVDGSLAVLIGAAPYVLTRGAYVVWAQYTASPEVPVVKVGDLSLT